MLLKGKNILVTGGSRGLGRAFCTIFCREGANVAFNYSADEHGAAQTLEEAAAFGTRVLDFKASVTDKTAVEDMVTRIEEELPGLGAIPLNRYCRGSRRFPLMIWRRWRKNCVLEHMPPW